MGLDDARRRLAAGDVQRTQAFAAAQFDHTAHLLVEVTPLLQRLLLATQRHISVADLRQQFLTERREQFAVKRRDQRKLKSKDFTSVHRLMGDFEGASTYTGVGLWLNGDGPGGVVLFSYCYFQAAASWRPGGRLRIQMDLNAKTWQVQVRQDLFSSGDVVGHRWVALTARDHATPGQPKVDDVDERERHLETIEMCAVQLVDHFNIPQAEVDA